MAFSHWLTGEFNNNYFLRSKFYISKRITDKFDRVTSSMIENGLHQFYWKFTTFLLKIRGTSSNADRIGEEFYQISLDNFYFPLLIYGSLMALATIVFAFETVLDYIKMCRHFSDQPVHKWQSWCIFLSIWFDYTNISTDMFIVGEKRFFASEQSWALTVWEV